MTGPIPVTRGNKRKSKKRKTFFVIMITLLILLIGAAGYIFWEYKLGQKAAGNSVETIVDEKDFNGVKEIEGIVNVLLLGLDEKGNKASRSDTIMIAQYNTDSKKAKLVSIMRDTYVEIPGHDKHRINDAFKYGGPEMVRKTIKENFDIDVQYYALVNYEGFTKVIDSGFPDGIKINVEKTMAKGRGMAMTLEPGVQRLDGKKLLAYARFRKDSQSDFGRVNRQQEVLKQIAEEAVSINGVLKLPRMIGTIQPFVETNMKTSNILLLGTSFFSSDNRDIESLRVPIDGTYWDEWHGKQQVLGIDLEKNKQGIQEFLK